MHFYFASITFEAVETKYFEKLFFCEEQMKGTVTNWKYCRQVVMEGHIDTSFKFHFFNFGVFNANFCIRDFFFFTLKNGALTSTPRVEKSESMGR